MECGILFNRNMIFVSEQHIRLKYRQNKYYRYFVYKNNKNKYGYINWPKVEQVESYSSQIIVCRFLRFYYKLRMWLHILAYLQTYLQHQFL